MCTGRQSNNIMQWPLNINSAEHRISLNLRLKSIPAPLAFCATMYDDICKALARSEESICSWLRWDKDIMNPVLPYMQELNALLLLRPVATSQSAWQLQQSKNEMWRGWSRAPEWIIAVQSTASKHSLPLKSTFHWTSFYKACSLNTLKCGEIGENSHLLSLLWWKHSHFLFFHGVALL